LIFTFKQSDTLVAENYRSPLDFVSLGFRCRNNSTEVRTPVLYSRATFPEQQMLPPPRVVVVAIARHHHHHHLCWLYQTTRLTCRRFSADSVVSSPLALGFPLDKIAVD
jgi:hypothetical protein